MTSPDNAAAPGSGQNNGAGGERDSASPNSTPLASVPMCACGRVAVKTLSFPLLKDTAVVGIGCCDEHLPHDHDTATRMFYVVLEALAMANFGADHE